MKYVKDLVVYDTLTSTECHKGMTGTLYRSEQGNYFIVNTHGVRPKTEEEAADWLDFQDAPFEAYEAGQFTLQQG